MTAPRRLYPVLLLAVLTLFLWAGAAVAQDATVPPLQLDIPSSKTPPPESQTPKKNVKEIGPEDLEAAEQYYNKCLQEEWPDRTPDTRQMYCACASERTLHLLNARQIGYLVTGEAYKPEPAMDSRRLLAGMIAPCLHYPMGEIEKEDCLAGNRYSRYFRTQEAYNAMCSCVQTKMDSYLKDLGLSMMLYLLKTKPDMENPIDAIRENSSYRTEREKSRIDCTDKFYAQ